MKASETERIWWAVMCLADADLERLSRQGDPDVLIPHNVSNQARYALRDKHGQNLDTIFDKAMVLYRELFAAQKAKDAEEKARWAKAKAIVDEARELLGKKDPDDAG